MACTSIAFHGSVHHQTRHGLMRSLIVTNLALGTLMLAVPRDLPAQATTDLPTRDRSLSVSAAPAFTIGGMDAPDWGAFGEDLRLAFDEAGNLHVLDEDNARVVVVGPDGGLIREFGRAGEGPGEFRRAGAMALLPTGGIVVFDRLRRRMIRFDRAGQLVADVPAAVGAGLPRSIHGHPGGGVIGDVYLYTLQGRTVARVADGMVPVQGRPIQHYHLDADSTTVLHSARTVTRPRSPDGSTPLTAFFPEFLMTVLPDGRAVLADSGAYLLTVLRPSGGVDRVLRRTVPRREITARIRDAERERLLDALAQGRPPENTATFGTPPSREEMNARHRRRIEAMAFPDSLPAIRGLRADAEGRIWVERFGAGPYEAGPIDVLKGDGAYIGTIPGGRAELPLAFGPGGLAAFMTRDALDVPMIHVRRLSLEEGDAGGPE
jgi:hypothetical protein